MSINKENLMNHFDNDVEMIKQLLGIFIQSYPESLGNIEKAIESKNFDDLRLHAHTLKGMCSNFFAEEAVALSLYLEKCGSEKNFADDIPEKFQNLKATIESAVKELESI